MIFDVLAFWLSHSQFLIYLLPPLSILSGSFYSVSTVLLDVYSTYSDSLILIIHSWEGVDTLSVEIAYIHQIAIFRPASTYSEAWKSFTYVLVMIYEQPG